MKLLPLSDGTFSKVDDDVYEWASRMRWHSHNKGYVSWTAWRRHKLLHRIIMDAPKGVMVDHINHDRKDNRRSNLRLATQSQNQQNRRGSTSRSKTGIRGVSPLGGHYSRMKYVAELTVLGKLVRVGYFETLEEASEAVEKARRDLMTHHVASSVASAQPSPRPVSGTPRTSPSARGTRSP